MIWRDIDFWFTCMVVCLTMDIWLWCMSCDSLMVGNNCFMLLSLQGGGLYLDSPSSATITGSTISYNSAVSFIDQWCRLKYLTLTPYSHAVMIRCDIDFWFTCMVVCLTMDIWMCCMARVVLLVGNHVMILVVTVVVIPVQQGVRRHARLVVSSPICIWSVSVRRPTTELCFCLHAHSLQKKLLLRDDLTWYWLLVHMHGCLFDNGYLNVLYGTRFLDGGQQLFNVAIIAGRRLVPRQFQFHNYNREYNQL